MGDTAGNLYGTTIYCGAYGGGGVYKVDSSGETMLYTFKPGNLCDPQCGDGFNPYAGVVLDSAGNLYGTTYYGGTNATYSYGSVYEVSASGTERVLYGFKGADDGANPTAGVIRDKAGNLYGTTSNGGADSCGVVFKVDRSGNETVLHTFTGGSDGCNPYAGVIGDSAGNLYGTTFYGGAYGGGVVYKVDRSGETVLHTFTPGNLCDPQCGDGFNPYSGVVLDSAGNLYGTTYYGGTDATHTYGSVYEVTASGTEMVLYGFKGGNDGGFPTASLIRDKAGNLYGTTTVGGKDGEGVVFKLTP